ncbi:RNA methyltransferase [Sanguibacter sp. HDW7]|uniref:TrmH family RNA methyltransferase n=1 Tax=Sanguibacter sp. HDW7 TaxID=2714931 RepID=UPI001F0E4A4B|nr:RNA methyltransferase [Sanguibacter sp. HDW7]
MPTTPAHPVLPADVDLVEITDVTAPGLEDYVSLTDVRLRSRTEPGKGLYIAESSTVIRRALAAGHRPRSFFMEHKWLPSMADVLAEHPGVPVYTGTAEVLEQVTGFHLHRGALASMHRPPLAPVAELLASARDGQGARRVVVLEDTVDHTNVGAAMRACAAMGVDAVLFTPSCADPLYRRAVRVSMGTVFQVPWTRFEHWPAGPADGAADGVELLRELGFTVAALALEDDSVSLDVLERDTPEKLALVFGTEGDGLKPRTITACDLTVKIPMAGGVDSLNVASAVAVAGWATRVRD